MTAGLLVGLLVSGSAIAADDISVEVVGTDYDELEPAVWGDRIAYTGEDVAGRYPMYHDFAYANQDFAVSGAPGNPESPDIWGDYIVWVDGSQVRYMQFESYYSVGEGIVHFSHNEQRNPAIYGDRVVWEEGTTAESDIHMYDFSTDTHSVICTATGAQVSPDIYGDLIVWQDGRGTYEEIYLYYAGRTPKARPAMQREHSLRDLQSVPPAIQTDQGTPRIHKNTIVFEQDSLLPANGLDVWRFDVPTSSSAQVAGGTGEQFDPSVYENVILYHSADSTPDDIDLYAYSMATDTTELLPVGTSEKSSAEIQGNKIAWQDNMRDADPGDWNDDIRMLRVAYPAERHSGNDRFQTASRISRQHFPIAETVVLATGYEFADALAASGLAGAYDGPLLLTKRGDVPADVLDEIDRLRAEGVIIVGGTSAVSSAVESALVNNGLAVKRIEGANRYATAAAVADEIEAAWAIRTAATGEEMPSLAFVARGDQFADALSASPVAYKLGVPILLTTSDALPNETENVLTGLEDAVVLGGTSAVTPAVQTSIDAAITGGPSVRWSGTDRYKTAVAIADESVEAGYSSLGYVATATGLNFPDALGGGAAAGANGGVLLLTHSTTLSGPVESFVSANRTAIGRLVVFGGTSAVSADIESELKAIWGTDGAAIWGTDGAAFGDPVFFDDPAQYLP